MLICKLCFGCGHVGLKKVGFKRKKSAGFLNKK
jgi:hypothetical protein